jgi:hypothetical protein
MVTQRIIIGVDDEHLDRSTELLYVLRSEVVNQGYLSSLRPEFDSYTRSSL